MPSFCKIVAQFDSTDHGFDFLISIVDGNPSDALIDAGSILIDELVNNSGHPEKESKDFVDHIIDELTMSSANPQVVYLENLTNKGPAGNRFESISISSYNPGDVIKAGKCDWLD